jgi:diaminobutyrate-2-oxoglutarate transaminase
MTIIDRLESNVRSYCRAFPTTFTRAEGAMVFDVRGKGYIDFFAGAGALNYGHNEPRMREALIDYLTGGGITHSLDMTTEAKVQFLESVEQRLLKPRELDYKVLFPGPTGTNAVETAIKLARRATGRSEVLAFTNAFHGMTLGSLALSGNAGKRAGAGVPLPFSSRAPFASYGKDEMDTLSHLRTLLEDSSSGFDKPAAIIVETVQAEGGVNVASDAWVRGLAELARDIGTLLIVDDIQVGCGRTGAFFSFERAGIKPDIVCLSKSLSGYGVPFSMVLLRPELDVFEPGEHNGTFRGHNLAFVTARTALENYWADDTLRRDVEAKAAIAQASLREIADEHGGTERGLGLIRGIEFTDPNLARAASKEAFKRGIIMETAGPEDTVLKLLCPLTIETSLLEEGLARVKSAVAAAARRQESGLEKRGPVEEITA